jgi:hypothetical protein
MPCGTCNIAKFSGYNNHQTTSRNGYHFNQNYPEVLMDDNELESNAPSRGSVFYKNIKSSKKTSSKKMFILPYFLAYKFTQFVV